VSRATLRLAAARGEGRVRSFVEPKPRPPRSYLPFPLPLCFPVFLVDTSNIMSAPDNEELIDYEDEQDVVTNGGAPGGAVTGSGEGDEKEKKSFSGIHSTGFRCAHTFS
jgi:hypothetical protein